MTTRDECTAREFLEMRGNASLLSPAQLGLMLRASDYQVAAQAYFDFSFEPDFPLMTHYAMLALGNSYQRFSATLVLLAFPELRESAGENGQRIHEVKGEGVRG